MNPLPPAELAALADNAIEIKCRQGYDAGTFALLLVIAQALATIADQLQHIHITEPVEVIEIA